METVIPGKRYRHYKKGAVYEVLLIAKDCEDASREMVVYRDTHNLSTWVRDCGDFEAMVNVDGDLVPRFKRID